MADKTLTVTTVGEAPKTLTFNRDRFAGVRTMTRVEAGGATTAITVNRTASSADNGDKVGQSRPLLSKVVGGAAAAYSLRDLNDRAGNNKVVRVRRASDNSEKDFTAKEVSNGTLTAWVGAGNDGFVETWYDQSGNDNNAVQLTASSQPKIVDGGVLVTGGLDFDGVDDYLITAQSGQFSQPVSLFQVFSSDALVASGRFQIDASSTFMLSGGESSIYYFAGYLLNSNINFPTGGDTLHSVVFNGSSSTVFADGSSVATGNVSSGAFQKTFSIGARRTGTQASNLSYKEFIIYNTDQSANREAIEANINNQYDIY